MADAAGANPQDDPLKDAFKATKSMFRSDARNESNKLFKKLDKDGSKGASHDEIRKFVKSNDKLWSLLSVNLDQPPAVATKIATRVCMELATGLQGEEAMEAELTKDQFHQFRKKYILDPAGSQEFFFRAVFASFDTDNNAVLDEEELDNFLEIFYKSGSTFQGAMGTLKLPPKEKLHEIFLKEFDGDDDKELSFDEVRTIISGQVDSDVSKEIEEAAEQAEKEQLEQEKLDAERSERLEQERLEAEREEEERRERERKEKEAAEASEKERLAEEEEEKRNKDKSDAERKEKERREKEREVEEKKKKDEQKQKEEERKKAEQDAAQANKTTTTSTKKEETPAMVAEPPEEDGCAFFDWLASLFDSTPEKK